MDAFTSYAHVVPTTVGHPEVTRERPELSPEAGVETSSNWSGGVIYAPSGQAFKSVSGTLNVPQPWVPYQDGTWYYSVHWIGLDGDQSSDVFQAGVCCNAMAANNGLLNTQIYAWYEWANTMSMQEITNFAVSPGDTVSVSLVATSDTTGTAILVNDTRQTSTHVNFSAEGTDKLVGNCAEWISERQKIAGSLPNLAGFDDVYYTACEAATRAVRPATGEVLINGHTLTAEPAVARRAGVEMVFQELALCPDLNVADNLVLGQEPRGWMVKVLPVRDVGEAERTARARLNELGIGLADLRKPVRLLSGGERQLVQILRVMRPDISLVILDEPTSALGLNQAAEVRALARAIAEAGTPVLMITHDVEEVFEVADRVVVLQRGQLVFDGPIDSVSRLELLRMMSGKRRVEAARIMDAVSSERKRIERDLHDGAQQGLVNAALMLGLAIDQLRKSGNDSVANLLNASLEAVRTAGSELRDLSRGLYPTLLGDEGLVPAVEVLLGRSTVPVDLRADELPRLGEPVEIAAYFVVAEALTNVLKHAQASRVTIEISYDGRELSVLVADDGNGAADETGGSGLRGLRDRVGAVDGTLVVHSEPGVGTAVAASFPVAGAVSLA
jgi:signal transduction histidine kinase